MFFGIYNVSLFISLSAFLPSLRVLKTSQDREKRIRKVSVIREIKVISIPLVILLTLFRILDYKFKIILNVRPGISRY